MSLSQRTLAQVLDIDRARLRRMVAEGMPCAYGGRAGRAATFELEDVARWLAHRKSASSDALSLEAEKTRLTKAQADKYELHLAVARGELLDASELETEWGKVATAVRAKVLSIPTKCAPRWATAKTLPEAQRVLKGACHDALKELLQFDPEGYIESKRRRVAGRGPDILPADPAAEGSDGEPVGGRVPDAQPRGQRRARHVDDVSGRVPARDHGRRQ